MPSTVHADRLVVPAAPRPTLATPEGATATAPPNRSGQVLAASSASRELGRLVDRSEIEALLRVPAAAAGSVLKLMIATYTDDAGPLQIAWCLQGAYSDGVGTHGPITDGNRVVLADRDRLESLVESLHRDGVNAVAKTDEPELRNLVVVDANFDLKPHRLPKWRK